MNNELIKEIKGKTYHFKFKSKKLVDLEKLTGKTIIDLLREISFSNIAKALKYACVEEVDEYELLDDLLEEMTFEQVVTDILVETCKVSGIISQRDVDNMKEKLDEEKSDLKN